MRGTVKESPETLRRLQQIIDQSGRVAETVAEQGYAPDAMVTVEVTPERIYAIRPPKGHHAYQEG